MVNQVLEGVPSTILIVIKSGVPQGTLLSPLCFLLHFKDMGDDII